MAIAAPQHDSAREPFVDDTYREDQIGEQRLAQSRARRRREQTLFGASAVLPTLALGLTAMTPETRWSIAAVVVGLLAGPLAAPMLGSQIPVVGWVALLSICIGFMLAPPLVLFFQAAGGQYMAMVRTWSLFFFFALFIAAAGASGFAVSAAATPIEPAALVFLAAGLGLLISLSSIKLMLLRKSAKKGA